jgi:hypothetical protein
MENLENNDFRKVRLLIETIEDTKDIQSRYKGMHQYEVIHNCVKFFKEKGFDPRSYYENLPSIALDTLRKDVIKSNEDVKNHFIKFIRTHEKTFLNPVAVKLETAVNLLVQHLREQKSFEFDSNLKSEKSEKNPEWLAQIVNDIVPKNVADEKRKEEDRKDKDLLIKNERLISENQRLKEQLNFIKSKIQTKKSTFGGTQYIVDLDEIELDDFLKK